MEIITPPQMIKLAAELGAKVPAVTTIDEQSAIEELLEGDSDFSGDPDFGFSLKSAVKGVVRRASRSVKGKVKGAVSVKAKASASTKPNLFQKKAIQMGLTTAFGIKSKKMPMKTAMAAADQVLRSKNARVVVRNTKAFAALGNKAAQRGLITLNAVAQVRKQKKIPVKARAIPAKAPPARTVAVKKTTAQVKRIASAAVATPRKQGIIPRIIAWFKEVF